MPRPYTLPAAVPLPKYQNNPIYHKRSPASPVHLSSSVVIASNSNGAPSQTALKNPMGQDMELLEIKFELSGAFNGSGSSTSGAFGATILADLKMGSIPITNGSVPVWNFGRAENLAGETNSDSQSSTVYMSYSWKLPRPLYVPAGAVVLPNFSHAGLIPGSINVRIGYSARTVFVKPKKIYVPWVASYTSKAFNPITAAGVDSSTELQLVNSNPDVFHLQRFVGRTLLTRANGDTLEDLPQSFGSQYLTMRMVDSYGRPIVATYTPFRDVFFAGTRSWEMDNGSELDPEAFYRVQLRKTATTLSGGSLDTGASAQAFISMVGWREVEALS